MKDKKDIYTYLKDTNDRVYEQLSYAEAKHAVVIGLMGAALFAIISIIIDIKEFNVLWLQIILGVMSLSLFIAMIVSFSSFYPHRKTLNKQRKRNLFFYGDLAKADNGEDYLYQLKIDDDIDKQLAEQNIVVSRIIERKHVLFQVVLKLSLASMILPYYLVLIIEQIILLVKWRNHK